MATAVAPRPVHAEAAPPLHTGMMGMFIFLASEVMFFGSLFAVYFYLFGSHLTWPPPGTKPVHFWPLPAINTVVLISSGFTCHFALESLGGERTRWQRNVGAPAMALACLGLVIMVIRAASPDTYFEIGLGLFGAAMTGFAALVLFGVGPLARVRLRRLFFLLWILTILLGAGFESGQAFEFYTANIRFATNIFSSAFFLMTGFHGLHVAGGLVLLLLILGRATAGHFAPQHIVGPAAVTLYWHFVDVVWIFLFAILYVAVTANSPA